MPAKPPPQPQLLPQQPPQHPPPQPLLPKLLKPLKPQPPLPQPLPQLLPQLLPQPLPQLPLPQLLPQLPKLPPLLKPLLFPQLPQQGPPIGQAGGAPISVISLTLPSQMPASTPVKPQPEAPPLVVKIVTVLPIYLCKLSTKLNSPIVVPPFKKVLGDVSCSILWTYIKKCYKLSRIFLALVTLGDYTYYACHIMGRRKLSYVHGGKRNAGKNRFIVNS